MGAVLLLLAACDAAPITLTNKADTPRFPAADRPIAKIVSPRWSTEEARDRLNEAEEVMDRARIAPGMTVADIGAGEGYYTIRLAARVGAKGRVLAEDIVPGVRDGLAQRVTRERLDNVSVRLGEPDDPELPENSFDRVMMVHMYHEIAEPYAFLWNLRPSLKAGGAVVVVDADRTTQNHGTPPRPAGVRVRRGRLQADRAAEPALGRRLYRAVPPRRPTAGAEGHHAVPVGTGGHGAWGLSRAKRCDLVKAPPSPAGSSPGRL